jgi:SSS family solute:Na+ symporter
MNLHPIDAGIVIFYLIMLVAIGIYMERRAGKNIESYFLGGGKMPWWLLGMSGSSTYFDITGTMWMVSTFYVLGVRGLWEHWLWCFPFAGFLLAYKGKWNYRSGVLTNMEWIIFRYGDDRAGRAARFVNVIVVLSLTILMLGYAGTGVGKFFQEFIPIPKNILIPLLFSLTGLYVILGGFFSVVYSDFFQTILLSFGAVYIAIVAFLKIDPEIFRNAVGSDWFSISPVWKLPTSPAGYQDAFELLVILWVTKGFIGLFSQGAGSSGAEFQRFRAARNEADASKIAMAWGFVFSVRWALVMAFTVFGLSILSNQAGAIDSERVLPIVLNRVLPVGIKGLVLAGLIAAFMSTFDSTLNVAASYIVNDLIKPIWKQATPKKLMLWSYISTFVILVLGIIISLRTEQIRDIWNPINFALGSALIVPALLAPYWWRIGGWAHCASGIVTLIAAFFIYFFTNWNELRYFPVLAGISLVSCLIFSYLFPPASNKALKNYFRTIRPFGFWKPVRKMLLQNSENPDRFQRDRFDIPVAIVATGFFIVLYLLMMDLVLHNWSRIIWLIPIEIVGCIYLYLFWWKKLIPGKEVDHHVGS